MVRKRLPPDVDLPPPRQPVTGGLSATMTAATGGSAGPVGVLLLPVSGTVQQRRKQRDEGALLMLTLPPLQCAESVYFHDPDEAESVLLAIAELAITLGTSRQPVASYLAEAMSARIFSSCLGLYAPLLHALRHGGMPRISASMESLEITRKRLSNLALDRSFEFEFCPVANKVGNLDPDKLVVDTRRREVVAVHWLHYSLYDSNTLCIIRRKEDETKHVLAKQYGDGGEEELFHINPGLNTTPLSLPESPEENTTCNLHGKGKYEPPKVWLKKENRENKKRKPEAHFFSALKVTEIKKSTRYVLLLVLFCTLITMVDSSSRGQSSSKVLCPKSDATSFLLPRHAKVCPKVDISTIHLTHSKRGVPPTSPASSSQEREESCPGRCVALVFIASVAGCVGPW